MIIYPSSNVQAYVQLLTNESLKIRFVSMLVRFLDLKRPWTRRDPPQLDRQTRVTADCYHTKYKLSPAASGVLGAAKSFTRAGVRDDLGIVGKSWAVRTAALYL